MDKTKGLRFLGGGREGGGVDGGSRIRFND